MEQSPGESGNEVGDARIQGDIVQARDVAGGIHFHGVPDDSRGREIVPRQLPADVSAFVNRGPELRALSQHARQALALIEPFTDDRAAQLRQALGEHLA